MRRRREEERTEIPNRDPTRCHATTVRVPRLPGSEPPRMEPRQEGGPMTTSKQCSIWLTYRRQLSDKALAEKSGGRVLRADTLGSLPMRLHRSRPSCARSTCSATTRLNKERDERYRHIKVTTTRKHVVIRARPGYLATNAR
jgi:hypothetical protein